MIAADPGALARPLDSLDARVQQPSHVGQLGRADDLGVTLAACGQGQLYCTMAKPSPVCSTSAQAPSSLRILATSATRSGRALPGEPGLLLGRPVLGYALRELAGGVGAKNVGNAVDNAIGDDVVVLREEGVGLLGEGVDVVRPADPSTNLLILD